MEIKERIKLNKVTHSVRASQAVLQYGVGAMVDFPEQTLMTAAPETWSNSVMEIHDERLEKVLKIDYIGMPGSNDEVKYQNGISYARFPEWYFCPKCRTFKPLKEWLYDYAHSSKTRKSYAADPNMIRHLRCPACFQELVVARIVVACGHGHIDDFPWIKWVHARNNGGPKKICSHPKLRFTTSASSTEGLEGLTVTCENCKARTTLRGAFDKDALKNLDEKTGYEYDFTCTGRHPWKNSVEPCGEYPRVLQRGASSVYFPVSISSLVIPPYSSKLTELVQNSQGFSDLRKAITESLKTFKTIGIEITEEIRQAAIQGKISEYTNKIALEIGKAEQQVKSILERKWSGESAPDYTTTSVKYRAEEYVALNGEVSLDDNQGEFVREATNIEDYGLPYIKNISLIHKVREVKVLKGFSRLEPIDSETTENQDKIRMVDVKSEETNWYPGYELRGEGIFIEFDEDAIDAWRSNNPELDKRVALINENYNKSYYGEKKPRMITAKFLLLHTLSHLLMKQLSFECGYSIASIQERLYCSEPAEGKNMSGIFIFTASGDSEGTMGGLVRQGRADVFPAIFKKAIESALACSNDPVCSLSQGQGRDSLNLAACYSCTLVPETSCEEFNVFLDRGTVIGTFEQPSIGFYSDFVHNWNIPNKPDNEQKETSEIRNVLVVDFGIDLKESDYKIIWEEMSQFADSEDMEMITILLNNADSFFGKEKPGRGATIQLSGLVDEIDVDLLWKQSKVMLFTHENHEEYLLAQNSDWTCFSTSDDNFDWNKLRDSLREV